MARWQIFSGRRGGDSRVRRDEIRRNLPRPDHSAAASLRRPETVHGVLFVAIVAVAATMLWAWTNAEPPVAVGRIAATDHLNRHEYERVDETATAGQREEARRAAPRIYRPNSTYLDRLRASIEGLPVAVREKTDLDGIDAGLREEFSLDADGLARLQSFATGDGPSADWREWTRRFMHDLWSVDPLLPGTEYQIFATTLRREVMPPGGDAAESTPVTLTTALDLAATAPGSLEAAVSRLADRAGFPVPVVRFVISPIVRDPRPTIAFDAEATELAARAAAAAVAPVLVRTPRNDLIIARGDRVTPRQAERLAESAAAARANESWIARWLERLGVAGLAAAAATLFAIHLARSRAALLRNPGRMLGLLVMTGGLAAIGVAGAVEWPGGTVFAAVFAVSAAAMFATLCYDGRLGIAVSALTVVLIAGVLGTGIGFALALFVVASVAIATLHDLRSRGGLIRAGGVAATAAAGAFVLLGIVEVVPLGGGWLQVLGDGLAAGAAALSVGFIVLGTLPLLERVFDVATGLTLSELRDPRQPLLRLLQERAPGTYSHSLQIATIAETAADAIGADGLLVYCGALYHDIGKVNKPDYFIENQGGGANRHDKLSPAMSLLVIVGHVKDGVAMAREQGLPKVLHHFIESHHGTTLVEYFYRAAVSRAEALGESEGDVAEVDFRYPGPKPRTREAAILMLCDASESASRTLSEPSPKAIEALVRKLARIRLEDGQFDECALTFQELRRVEDSIVKSLVSLHHGRIGYRSTSEIAAEPAAEAPTAPSPRVSQPVEAGVAAGLTGTLGPGSPGSTGSPGPTESGRTGR
jgi:putative nucleotidyltransferase with HDIG domain